jgi:hypothetical protein
VASRGYNGKRIMVVSPGEEYCIMVETDYNYNLHTKEELGEALDLILQEATEDTDEVPWYDQLERLLNMEESA